MPVAPPPLVSPPVVALDADPLVALSAARPPTLLSLPIPPAAEALVTVPVTVAVNPPAAAPVAGPVAVWSPPTLAVASSEAWWPRSVTGLRLPQANKHVKKPTAPIRVPRFCLQATER